MQREKINGKDGACYIADHRDSWNPGFDIPTRIAHMAIRAQ